MKIICIEGNYPPHGGNGADPGAGPGTEPVWFLKPDTAMLRNNDPFYIPRFTREVHAACGLIVRISRVGRAVSERFAHRYYDEVGVGIDFTARDLQRQAAAEGLPWERAKAFDHSIALPPRFVRLAEAGGDVARLRFALDVNGERRQTGDMRELLFPVDRLIAAVSRYMTLRMGDLLFTGTPAGAGPVQAGDNLRATLEGYGMLDFDIR
ncbi:fumarylacetoacetate hydrolase family protein [Alistipes dispar]|uniref:fumarylacetoacetate hydrolase family protein n=1 Tax=Alistipes dispar TaxID=2585119 RepID=UPI003A8B0B1A